MRKLVKSCLTKFPSDRSVTLEKVFPPSTTSTSWSGAAFHDRLDLAHRAMDTLSIQLEGAVVLFDPHRRALFDETTRLISRLCDGKLIGNSHGRLVIGPKGTGKTSFLLAMRLVFGSLIPKESKLAGRDHRRSGRATHACRKYHFRVGTALSYTEVRGVGICGFNN